MQGRRLKIVLVILAIMIVASIVIIGLEWFWPYNINTLSGDGRITDGGFWSYPRYRITYPQFSLRNAATFTYISRRLPPVPLTLGLYFSGRAHEAALKGSDAWIEFKLVEVDGSPNGNTICQGGGPLKDWVLATSPASLKHTYFWHLDFRDVKVKRRAEYILYLIVKNVDPAVSHISLEPRLSGGGNEVL